MLIHSPHDSIFFPNPQPNASDPEHIMLRSPLRITSTHLDFLTEHHVGYGVASHEGRAKQSLEELWPLWIEMFPNQELADAVTVKEYQGIKHCIMESYWRVLEWVCHFFRFQYVPGRPLAEYPQPRRTDCRAQFPPPRLSPLARRLVPYQSHTLHTSKHRQRARRPVPNFIKAPWFGPRKRLSGPCPGRANEMICLSSDEDSAPPVLQLSVQHLGHKLETRLSTSSRPTTPPSMRSAGQGKTVHQRSRGAVGRNREKGSPESSLPSSSPPSSSGSWDFDSFDLDIM